jgi:quinol monooxygenase YgiN
MVVTMLEAEVAHERVGDLERAFIAGALAVPPEIVDTFLVRDEQDETLFRIITIWVSREALDAMRASGEKPKGVQMFEAAGARPTLVILDVVAQGRG